MDYYILSIGQVVKLRSIVYSNRKKSEVVIDCGAYIGRLTIIAAKSVGVKGRVISIEPDPITFKLLLRNISLNKVADRVIPINVALSNVETPLNSILLDTLLLIR